MVHSPLYRSPTQTEPPAQAVDTRIQLLTPAYQVISFLVHLQSRVKQTGNGQQHLSVSVSMTVHLVATTTDIVCEVSLMYKFVNLNSLTFGYLVFRGVDSDLLTTCCSSPELVGRPKPIVQTII